MEKGDKGVILAGELAWQEADKKSETLAASKDKAQFTATTAMSIANITLLKQVIDTGPTTDYYYVSLCLLCICLVLQITIGLITIIVANIRKFYDQFRDELCKEFFQQVFGFRCVSKSSLEREKRIRSLVQEHEYAMDLSKWNIVGKTGVRGGLDFEATIDEESQGCCANCPVSISRRTHPNYEYDILDRYDIWVEQSVQTKLSVVEPREEVTRITLWLDSAKRDVSKLESSLESETTETGKKEIKAKLTALQNTIAEEKAKAEAFENILKHEKIMSAQGEILSKYTDAIRKNRVLKLVSFWQQVINYMLYCVFIINAFIAGFGIATPTVARPEPVVDGANTNNTICAS